MKFTFHSDQPSFLRDEAAQSGELGVAVFWNVDTERFTVRLHPGGRVDGVAEQAVAGHRKTDNTSNNRTWNVQ